MSDFVSRRRCRRIVLVEDDDNLALVLRYNLEAWGYAVDRMSDGLTVLGHLLVDPPDAVVLDWTLPGLSGIEILRRMRTCSGLKSVPVLMLTARCLPEDRQRATETGANAFLAKPFSLVEIIATVHRLTGPAAAEQPIAFEGAMS